MMQKTSGEDTYFTEDEVLKRVNQKGAAALVIGPAGENLVRYAVIENDYWRSLGRTGVGAVMGSKKGQSHCLHGEKKREQAHPDQIQQFAKETLERGKDTPGAQNYRRLGTPMLVAMNIPSRDFHQNTGISEPSKDGRKSALRHSLSVVRSNQLPASVVSWPVAS